VHPGKNVAMGRDYTIFATTEGTVKFTRLGKDKKRVHVIPLEEKAAAKS